MVYLSGEENLIWEKLNLLEEGKSCLGQNIIFFPYKHTSLGNGKLIFMPEQLIRL